MRSLLEVTMNLESGDHARSIMDSLWLPLNFLYCNKVSKLRHNEGASKIRNETSQETARKSPFGENLRDVTLALKLKWEIVFEVMRLMMMAYPSLSTAIKILESGEIANTLISDLASESNT